MRGSTVQWSDLFDSIGRLAAASSSRLLVLSGRTAPGMEERGASPTSDPAASRASAAFSLQQRRPDAPRTSTASSAAASRAHPAVQAAVQGHDDERALVYFKSPMAFADRELERDFLIWQKLNYSTTATYWALFQIALTVVTGLRMVALGLANRRVYALVGGSIAFWLGSVHVLRQLPGLRSPLAWLLLDLCLRVQFYVWGVVGRGGDPGSFGKVPLSFVSFYVDFMHEGGCTMMLLVPAFGLPLPYWANLVSQASMATLWTLHNPWHCRRNLAPDHLPATVGFLSQVMVRPLTFFTSLLMASGRTPPPCNHSLLESCEAVVSAVQLLVGLGSALISIGNEASLRRAFLASRPSARARSRAGDPVSPSCDLGPRQLVDAALIPVLGYCVMWQAWLPLQQLVTSAWEAGLPASSLLRMSFWLQ